MALTKVGGLMIDGPLLLSSGSEVTIAAGAITVTDNLHAVDTEADAASDDLETITGGSDGPYARAPSRQLGADGGLQEHRRQSAPERGLPA